MLLAATSYATCLSHMWTPMTFWLHAHACSHCKVSRQRFHSKLATWQTASQWARTLTTTTTQQRTEHTIKTRPQRRLCPASRRLRGAGHSENSIWMICLSYIYISNIISINRVFRMWTITGELKLPADLTDHSKLSVNLTDCKILPVSRKLF